MSKHIGIVACSAEGAALCYRTICMEGASVLGEYCHPEITMHTYPLSDYMIHVRKRDWPQVAQMMLSSVRKLASVGAQLAICPDNTIHEAFEWVVRESPIPWLHIARVVAESAQARGFQCLGILGTKYLMEGPVYPDALKELNLSAQIPDLQARREINTIIFKELVNGVITNESRDYFNKIISELKERGCDAVVLGCTEIPLIVCEEDAPLPTLDSTRLLSRAALKAAVE